jgi:CRP-like cAMP-binding protein
VAIFKDCDPLFVSQAVLALRPKVAGAGETIIRKNDMGREMYIVVRGEAEVLDDAGHVLRTFRDGDFFGEIALLIHTPRTATVRAKTVCDLMVLDQPSFSRILHDYPQFAESVLRIARERYDLNIHPQALVTAARG